MALVLLTQGPTPMGTMIPDIRRQAATPNRTLTGLHNAVQTNAREAIFLASYRGLCNAVQNEIPSGRSTFNYLLPAFSAHEDYSSEVHEVLEG